MTLLVDMTKVEEKSIHVLEFTGRHEDWKVWSVKFLARGSKKGYKSVVIGDEILPKKANYLTAKGKIAQTRQNKRPFDCTSSVWPPTKILFFRSLEREKARPRLMWSMARVQRIIQMAMSLSPGHVSCASSNPRLHPRFYR